MAPCSRIRLPKRPAEAISEGSNLVEMETQNMPKAVVGLEWSWPKPAANDRAEDIGSPKALSIPKEHEC